MDPRFSCSPAAVLFALAGRRLSGSLMLTRGDHKTSRLEGVLPKPKFSKSERDSSVFGGIINKFRSEICKKS